MVSEVSVCNHLTLEFETAGWKAMARKSCSPPGSQEAEQEREESKRRGPGAKCQISETHPDTP